MNTEKQDITCVQYSGLRNALPGSGGGANPVMAHISCVCNASRAHHHRDTESGGGYSAARRNCFLVLQSFVVGRGYDGVGGGDSH